MAGSDKSIARRGLMLVLSSPSGAGKTTLSRMLVERMPGLKMSVSATTRPKRPGEVNGRDYLFVDKARFEAMVMQGELLEWAIVFDNRYGTPRAPVEAALCDTIRTTSVSRHVSLQIWITPDSAPVRGIARPRSSSRVRYW